MVSKTNNVIMFKFVRTFNPQWHLGYITGKIGLIENQKYLNKKMRITLQFYFKLQ
jgi:hypothetical protein